MARPSLWLEALAGLKALYDLASGRPDYDQRLKLHREDPATQAEAQRVSGTYSTFSDKEIEELTRRIEGCRKRFIEQGGGLERTRCLCSIFEEIMQGNGGKVQGDELFVRRAVWRRDVGDTKTIESKSRVPVIKPLRKLLDAHRQQDGKHVWIFSGERGFSLNLDNLTKRVIRPALGDRFHGWHAFRRGLVGILFDAGVDVEVAKVILRHSDSSVTRRHYLILDSQKQGAAAMKTLEKILTVRNKRGTARAKKKSEKSLTTA